MQAKLLEAVAGQRDAARQLQEAQQEFDGERAHLEQQVRRSKEEGSVRIHTLEDTIRKLGNRSELHQVQAALRSLPGHQSNNVGTCIVTRWRRLQQSTVCILRPCRFSVHPCSVDTAATSGLQILLAPKNSVTMSALTEWLYHAQCCQSQSASVTPCLS